MNILVLIFVFSCLVLPKMVDNTQVIELEVISHELYDAIDHFFDHNVVEYNWKESVLVLRIENKSGQAYIRIAPVKKDNFTWYLREKKTSVYGFFSYEDKTILVFGEDFKGFFNKTNNSEDLKYLEITEEDRPEIRNGRIPLPPSYIEPHVFIYKYVGRKFIFYKDGLFYLLD
jgi:hypothetical protein